MDPNLPINIRTASGDFVAPLGPQNPVGRVLLDEETYRNKIRQLGKYVEPLRKLIDKMGPTEDVAHVENVNKLEKLLKILTDPNEPMSLINLVKCEILLKKIFSGEKDEGLPLNKLDSAFQALLSAVSQNLQSPLNNHTFHRTFGPVLDNLFADEKLDDPWFEFGFNNPMKQQVKPEENATGVIPDVLQGEIARLEKKFRVTLDNNQPSSSESIHLVCSLEDEYLPHIPSIYLTVPAGYPKESPLCQMRADEYNATKFLSDVKTVLLARIENLPKYYSVSHLLDSWEMSVRQAASPNFNSDAVNINSFAVAMGL